MTERLEDRDWQPAAELVERFRADLGRLNAVPGRDDRIAVAVSGGGDSLALLLLAAAAWPGCVEAATVDHGFRAGAAAEARAVAAVCARIGVPHIVLASHGIGEADREGGSLQMRARAIRYRLLEEWAARGGLTLLATAHHRDDQAETLLLRIARGSGVPGLSAIRTHRTLGGELTLIRPLLGWRRAELAAVVASAGLAAADDPSNRDERHDRTRARRLLAETLWLSPDRLAAVADHARDADDALGWAADRLWSERVAIEDMTLRIDMTEVPRELRRRLLESGIAWLTPPDAAPPRADRVVRLLDRLDRGIAGTIGGVKASPGRTWRLERAPPRRGG